MTAEPGYTDRILAAMDREHPPKLRITQCGRWSYWIDITHHGIISHYAGLAFGRARAERKGARIFARYLAGAEREHRWGPERIEITGDAL